VKHRKAILLILFITFVGLLVTAILLYKHLYQPKQGTISDTSLLKNIKIPETADEWGTYLGTHSFNYCNRKEAIKLKPEFERSLSLIFQRLKFEEKLQEIKNSGGSFREILMYAYMNRNCLDIEYANSVDEMRGADGLFLFSSEYSSPDSLKIIVSPEFKSESDLLTALLLSHELTHATQFISEETFKNALVWCNKVSNKSNCRLLDDSYGGLIQRSCYEKEVEAFLDEIRFFTTLNKGEIQILIGSYSYYKNWGYTYPREHLSLELVAPSNNWKKLAGRSGNSGSPESHFRNPFQIHL